MMAPMKPNPTINRIGQSRLILRLLRDGKRPWPLARYELLLTLADAGENGMKPSAIGKAIGKPQYKLIRELEAAGVIDGDKETSGPYRLTPKGEAEVVRIVTGQN